MFVLMNLFSLLLGVYVIAVSLEPLANMNAGMHCFCHKMKYIAAIAAASWVVWLAIFVQVHVAHLVIVLVLSLFCWPRTVFMIKKHINYKDESELGTATRYHGWNGGD